MQGGDAFVSVKGLHSDRLIKKMSSKGKGVDTAGTDVLQQNTLQSWSSVQMLPFDTDNQALQHFSVDCLVVYKKCDSLTPWNRLERQQLLLYSDITSIGHVTESVLAMTNLKFNPAYPACNCCMLPCSTVVTRQKRFKGT